MSVNLFVDTDLLQRFRKGDERAFEMVYSQHAAKIYRFAYSFLKDKVLSEEVVQETFLNIWVKREQLEIDKPLAPYLFTICRRLVMDSFRKTTRAEIFKAEMIKTMEVEDNQTEQAIMFSDFMRFAETAIVKLPKQQQLVFKLSRFEGLSYDEIADQLKISRNTVKNHLVASLKTLKAQFLEKGILYLFLIFFN
jgi:RNA polymerase sigma-70 factor (family 1)